MACRPHGEGIGHREATVTVELYEVGLAQLYCCIRKGVL